MIAFVEETEQLTAFIPGHDNPSLLFFVALMRTVGIPALCLLTAKTRILYRENIIQVLFWYWK